MTIFDNIKYQNTDITNRNSLLELPPAIIKLFWKKAYIYHYVNNFEFNEACMWLSVWSYDRPEKYKKLFNEALKEYEPI